MDRVVGIVIAGLMLGTTAVGGVAAAQSCDCQRESNECCNAWGRTREFDVRARVTLGEVRVGDSTLPTPSAPSTHLAHAPRGVRTRADVSRPDPLDPGGLLPDFPVPIARDDEALGSFAVRYHELLAIDHTDERAHDLTLRLQRAIGSDGGDSADRWLLIGELRRRLGRYAFERNMIRFEQCTENGGDDCGSRPRLNTSYARRAFESAAQHGEGTPAHVEAELRRAEMLIGTPRGPQAIPILERIAGHDDARIARRAHARLAEALLTHGQGPRALEQLDAMGEGGEYAAFLAYSRVAAFAEGGRAVGLFDAAIALLALEGVAPRYRANTIRLATVAAAELGRWGADAFEAAPEGTRPQLHAAMAVVAWDAGHPAAAVPHARAGMSAFSPREQGHWRGRIEEHGDTVAPHPPPVASSEAAPTEESGMLAWLTHAARHCMRQAAESSPPFAQGRVRWSIRLAREAIVSRPTSRSSGPGMDALIGCLREPPAPPVQPRRSTEISADLALSVSP